MKINTRHFGEVSIEENKIIKFAEGIPGFPNSKNYVMLSKKDQNQLFCWLQSVDETDTAFALTVPYVFYPDYKPDVAVKEFIRFLDILNNWYIRLNRDRFWDEDKSAFETLHYVLITFCKLLAPFAPFISEYIFKNLYFMIFFYDLLMLYLMLEYLNNLFLHPL